MLRPWDCLQWNLKLTLLCDGKEVTCQNGRGKALLPLVMLQSGPSNSGSQACVVEALSPAPVYTLVCTVEAYGTFVVRLTASGT